MQRRRRLQVRRGLFTEDTHVLGAIGGSLLLEMPTWNSGYDQPNLFIQIWTTSIMESCVFLLPIRVRVRFMSLQSLLVNGMPRAISQVCKATNEPLDVRNRYSEKNARDIRGYRQINTGFTSP